MELFLGLKLCYPLFFRVVDRKRGEIFYIVFVSTKRCCDGFCARLREWVFLGCCCRIFGVSLFRSFLAHHRAHDVLVVDMMYAFNHRDLTEAWPPAAFVCVALGTSVNLKQRLVYFLLNLPGLDCDRRGGVAVA